MYVPASQLVQAVDSALDAYFPAPQERQALSPTPFKPSPL
jgi:hypothetical protein